MRLPFRTKLAPLLALVADLVLPVGPGFLTDRTEFVQPDAQEQVAQLAMALAAMESHSADLFSIPGVVGTAIGLGPNGQSVVKVYLADNGILGVPAALDGVPTVNEVTGKFYALVPGVAPAELWEAKAASSEEVNRKGHFQRPVPIGVSSGQKDVTAGTIGARVTNGNGEIFALSNNHVFANSNQADLGDAILQPGSLDGGQNPSDAIGTLADFEPIKFCQGSFNCPVNRIDAAIAHVTEENVSNSTPDGGYGTPRTERMMANLMTRVQKYGRTTGLTTGRVSGIFATVNVDYRVGIGRFEDQIIVTGSAGEFSAPGDSGSLVVAESGADARRPVGLLFGGSRLTTIISPIDFVLDRFEVEIDGQP